MNKHAMPGLLLAALLLMLVGCTDTPTGLDLEDPSLEAADPAPRLSLAAPPHAAAHASAPLIVVEMPWQSVEALRDGQPTKAQVEARLRIDPDGTARGALRWRTREDGPVVIRAVTGRGVFDEQGALVRADVTFREANGESVVATVTPDPDNPDCQLWDLLNRTSGETRSHDFPERARFEAEGRILQVRPVGITVPKQTTEALRNGEATTAHVEARLRTAADGTAEGEFHLETPEDGLLVLRAVKGRAFLDTQGEVVRVELVFHAREGGRFTATVTPDPDLPACQLWDFTGSSVQGCPAAGCKISFEVLTEIRVL